MHDVWLVACILLVASCSAPAFQGWLLQGCWLLVARILLAVLRQGRPPLRPELPACESTVRVCFGLWLRAVVCICLSLLLWSGFVFVAVVVVVCCCCCVCWWCALTLLALPCVSISIWNLLCEAVTSNWPSSARYSLNVESRCHILDGNTNLMLYF